jgi:hypothetical protein
MARFCRWSFQFAFDRPPAILTRTVRLSGRLDSQASVCITTDGNERKCPDHPIQIEFNFNFDLEELEQLDEVA